MGKSWDKRLVSVPEGCLQEPYSADSKALEENFHLGKMSLMKHLDCFVHSCIPSANNRVGCIAGSKYTLVVEQKGNINEQGFTLFSQWYLRRASVQTRPPWIAIPHQTSSGRVYQLQPAVELNATTLLKTLTYVGVWHCKEMPGGVSVAVWHGGWVFILTFCSSASPTISNTSFIL